MGFSTGLVLALALSVQTTILEHMFEVGLDQALYEVDDLDAAACLDRAAECDLQDRVSARRKLRLALRWCELNTVADPDQAADWGDGQRGALADCDLPVGGPGTPMVAAYAAAAFGARLGVTTPRRPA